MRIGIGNLSRGQPGVWDIVLSLNRLIPSWEMMRE